MSYNDKSRQTSNTPASIGVINQYHTDDLVIMPEDEVSRNLRQSQETLGQMRRTGASEGIRKFAEIEVCYLQREAETRIKRRMAHEQYLRYNPQFAPATSRRPRSNGRPRHNN